MKILFVDGTAGYSPSRLEDKPTGGILTSLTIIPRHLAACGWDVSVLSVHNEEETVQGVKHLKHPLPESRAKEWDVVVFNRNMINRDLVRQFSHARKIWWLHDIVDPTYLQDDAYTQVEDIVALSRYCRDSYSDFYGIPEAKFSIIPNGVDKTVFYPGATERRRDLFVAASAPIKGLYPLEYAFANMRRWNPEMELRIYSNQSLHDMENLSTHRAVLERLGQAGAKIMAPVSQRELARVFRQATALLMPNSYPEICSNLLLQAQACGLPVVASDIGSASEFIKHGETGLLTTKTPADLYWWWKDFTVQIAALHFDCDVANHISQRAPLYVKSWTEISHLWVELLSKTCVGAA